MSLTNKFRKPSHKDLGNYGLRRLKNKYSIEGLDDLISLLMYLVDHGFYSRLFDVYTSWEEPVNILSPESTEIALENRLLVLAYENLRRTPSILSSDLIEYFTFYYFFPFLEWVYSMNLEKNLTAADVRDLFKSRLGEKIVFALEDFDKIEKTPDPTAEFFQKLRKLKWESRTTKKIYRELDKIITLFIFDKYSFKESSFDIRQAQIILFLAGCSALKKERDKINTEDVITAYKTYFKIIKTDISKLIDRGEIEQKGRDDGYLFCEKCKGYYKLQPGESPDDFDRCQCGGKLRYYEDIDWLLEEKEDSK